MDALASRRLLTRLLGGGALIALGWGDRRVANAAPRSVHLRAGVVSQIALDAYPVACDVTTASGIVGVVLIGPMCPVMTQDHPCPDQPYAASLVVRDALGHELCLTQSGLDGRFQVGLPPGWYELVPVGGSDGLPYAASQSVVVTPDQFTEVTVSYDSGIR
jgi:hypothetical protein